jgi:hypothetical protein
MKQTRFDAPSSAAFRRFVGISAAVLFISASAFGTAILSGEDNISGTVTVDSSGIFFFVGATPEIYVPGSPDTGAYVGNTSGTIADLPGPPTLAPDIIDFTTFVGPVPGPIMFDLLTFAPGFGTAPGCLSSAVGSECTPPGSPITLTQATPTTVDISLNGTGFAYTGTSGLGETPTTVGFTTQFLNTNIPALLTAVETDGGVTDSYSATFISTATTVPEPATQLLMGAGLFLVGLIARKKIRR